MSSSYSTVFKNVAFYFGSVILIAALLLTPMVIVETHSPVDVTIIEKFLAYAIVTMFEVIVVTLAIGIYEECKSKAKHFLENV